jgi:hypothetical protein
MIETLQMDSPKTIGFKLSGKLHDQDYQSFVPTVETFLAAEGKVRLFVQFDDFHGWDLHAVWDDFKFSLKHYGDFQRIAMVGDRKWQAWMAQVCKPFTKATVRYFEAAQVDDARAWLREGVEPTSTV